MGARMDRPPSIRRASRRRAPFHIFAVILLGPISTIAVAQIIDRTAPTPVTNVNRDQLESLPNSRDLRTILNYHNQLRAEVDAPPLRWNHELAAGAAAYGPVISQGGTLRHSSREGRKTIRENLLQSPRGVYSPLEMVQVWGNEKRLFQPGTFPNVSADGNWASVGHYTQMIWETTTDVGCAIHSDPRYDWLICRYSPPGNRDGVAIGFPPTVFAQLPLLNINNPELPAGGQPPQEASNEKDSEQPDREVEVAAPANEVPQPTVAAPAEAIETRNFSTQRRVAFCGHMWIIVDTYDDEGKKTGELSLHFSPSGYEINPTRQDLYPSGFAFGVESTREADLRLIEMWRYQIANKSDLLDLPVMGPWSPGNNCWTQTLWWARYGIEPNEPVREPVDWPSDCEITPDPDWAEKQRRLGLAWDNAETVGEHLGVVGQTFTEAFRSLTDCFDSDDD
jgi:hypothetical protein